jgi:hypothetical protein
MTDAEPEGEEWILIPMCCKYGRDKAAAIDDGRRILEFCREQQKKHGVTNPDEGRL